MLDARLRNPAMLNWAALTRLDRTRFCWWREPTMHKCQQVKNTYFQILIRNQNINFSRCPCQLVVLVRHARWSPRRASSDGIRGDRCGISGRQEPGGKSNVSIVEIEKYRWMPWCTIWCPKPYPKTKSGIVQNEIVNKTSTKITRKNRWIKMAHRLCIMLHVHDSRLYHSKWQSAKLN